MSITLAVSINPPWDDPRSDVARANAGLMYRLIGAFTISP
jgi:hypothetical protein